MSRKFDSGKNTNFSLKITIMQGPEGGMEGHIDLSTDYGRPALAR